MRNILYILFLSVILSGPGICDDWPDWRGPNRDGTWRETGMVQSFASSQLDIKWRTPVGAGYSGPSVADNRVYLTDRPAEPDDTERVLCFDESTGKLLWSHSYDCKYSGVGYPAGPRASVIIDGDRAYSLGTMGHLFCFNAKSGKVLWKRDLNAEYDIKMPTWGIAAVPLIVDEKLVLNIGGRNNACVVALNKLTGKQIWRSMDDDASYSAPILIRQNEKPVVVVWTGNHVAGLDPASGKIYWQHAFEQKMIINIASPVLYKDYIFVSSFFDGAMLIKLDQNKLDAKVVWRRSGKNERRSDALHCCISTPLIKDDYIYGVDSYGELRCLELLTGDRVWEDLTAVKKNRWANIHLVQNGDLTWMFNEHGELIISRLSPAGFKEISRAKLIEPTTEQLSRNGIGVTWAHPAFANRHVFIRSDKELVCADLSEK